VDQPSCFAREDTGVNRDDVQRLFDLTGRVAIVTGGTRGIGRAIAEGFVAAGAKVAVASRKADACADTEAELREMGGEVIGVPTHMGDLDALDNLVTRTVDELGGIDILVNNAANALREDFGAFTPEAYTKSMDVNLRGPVFLVDKALPHLEKSGNASIVNVLSAGAFLFSAFTATYSAAKAGLYSFTRGWAADFAARGIRVNALAPGTVDTDMVRNNPPVVQESMANASFMKRAAHADEMVGPALFLASDASSFMTGQVLIVDGGLTPH
jgi:NAD(P)-dependent dehydrogenase (short-subunit alcohol dehydrogenase family)